MEKSTSSLSPATFQKGVRYLGLSFRSLIEGNLYSLDPILAEHCEEETDYGRLFAYCFRRFGYPNSGWDDYKELTNYYLNTSHPDMILRVVPYVGSNTDLQLRFMVTEAKQREVDAYARRAQKAWEDRALQWMEANCFPEWMEEWRAHCDTDEDMVEMFGRSPHWKDSLRWMSMPPYGEADSRERMLSERANAFYKKWWADYGAVEARPAFEYRSADWRNWDDADPLKALAQAAHEALGDLRTPVGVRDQAIDAFGEVNPDTAAVPAAAVAGYPSGALGNVAPVEFAELHKLIAALGEGDDRQGIAKATALLSEAVRKQGQ
jgi:hypothetical protein